MSHKRRTDEEQFALSVLLSQHILREIRHNTPPAISEVAELFDVTRHTVMRYVNRWIDTIDGDHPEMEETLRNWLSSLTNTPEQQQSYALLIRDMLSEPETWGCRSHDDIANALNLSLDNVRLYYGKFWQPGWPELPQRKRGWISQEAARAARLGDVEKLQSINAEEDELLAMRQDLIQQRLAEFVRPQPSQGEAG